MSSLGFSPGDREPQFSNDIGGFADQRAGWDVPGARARLATTVYPSL